MDSGTKRAVLVWHRRSGKDKTAINFTVKESLKRVGTYYHILPYYNQGRKAIWDGIDKDGFRFIDHFPKELRANTNEQEMRIELRNGSAWQVIGSDKIDAVVGTNPVGVVFSEFPLQRPEAWELIRPILAENGGWAIFVYTPRGMNHGWKLLQQAKEAGWFYQTLTVDDTGVIPKDVIAEEKKQMPQALFEQEYYCKFIEGASQVFRRIDENTGGELLRHPTKLYRLGVDLAKHQDWTVITPFDLHTFQAGEQERFNQMDWTLIKARIEAAARRWNDAEVILDSTGVGDPIFDDLQNQGLNIQGFKFSMKSREDLLRNLSLQLEQDRIKIPDDPGLKDELRSFTWDISDGGRIKASVPEGMTDDRVMSLALAVWGVPQNPLPHETRRQFSEFAGPEDNETYRFHY